MSEAGYTPIPGAPDAQALITLTADGADSGVQIEGPFEDLIGYRSVDEVLTAFIDSGFLSELVLQGAHSDGQDPRAAHEIASLLRRAHRVSAKRLGNAGDAGNDVDTVIAKPSEQKAVHLASRSDPDTALGARYSLHLHLSPADVEAEPAQAFAGQVEALKRDLTPKVEQFDFTGLFRGNMQAQAESEGGDS